MQVDNAGKTKHRVSAFACQLFQTLCYQLPAALLGCLVGSEGASSPGDGFTPADGIADMHRIALQACLM